MAKPTRDPPLVWSLLEQAEYPDNAHLDAACGMSSAISLKRIADTLDELLRFQRTHR